MRGSRQPKIRKKNVRIDCGRYLLRTLTVDDASDQWAGWMADPKNTRLVNTAPTMMTKQDIVEYIRQFDQKSHLLVGMFDKQNGHHVAFFRIDIDYALKRCLLFLMGEPKYRHWFLAYEIRVPFLDFIFETLDLEVALATGLASNRALTGFLIRNGWNLDKTLEKHVRSETDGTMLDLCFFSLTRQAWHAVKANQPSV